MDRSNTSHRSRFFRAVLLAAAAISFTVSCTSEEALVKNWRERMELDIGYSPEQAINTKKLISVSHRSAEIDEHAYHDGKCRWTYFVNRKTGLIESWRYDTEPENCQASYCFFCSW